MPEVNDEWVRQQMQDAKVKVGPGKAVLKLLDTWRGLGELTPALAKEAIEIFSKLAVNTALTTPDESEEVWIPALPGQLTVGDEVRVLPDAFDGEMGITHNGRRGKITGLRYGDVIFKSTDGKGQPLDGTHYSPYKLERRIR